MINEIIITAKFTTGTTIQDSDEAKRVVHKMFIDKLAKIGIFPDESGIFEVTVVDVEANKI